MEFIDAESSGKISGMKDFNRIKYRTYGSLRHVFFLHDLGKWKDFTQIVKYGFIKVPGHSETGKNPVRGVIKRRFTTLAVKSPFSDGKRDLPPGDGDMPDGLCKGRTADDTVIRAAKWTGSFKRNRKVEEEDIFIKLMVDMVNGNIRRQLK